MASFSRRVKWVLFGIWAVVALMMYYFGFMNLVNDLWVWSIIGFGVAIFASIVAIILLRQKIS